jgi:hypothetical protein
MRARSQGRFPTPLKAGDSRWNEKGASVIATEDETSVFEFRRRVDETSAGETAEGVDQIADPRVGAERRVKLKGT